MDQRDGYVDRYRSATGNHVEQWDWCVARYGDATGNCVKHSAEGMGVVVILSQPSVMVMRWQL